VGILDYSILYTTESASNPNTASRVSADFAEATVQLDLAVERLRDIETTLGPKVVQRLVADSQGRGGEQYRPDDTKIACKLYCYKGPQ